MQVNDVGDPRRLLQDAPEDSVADFLTKGCGCKLYKNTSCSVQFSEVEVTQYRQECQELDFYENGWNKLDLVVSAQLRVISRTMETSHGHRAGQRQRVSQSFRLRNIEVCEAMYLFAHAIKIKRFKRILKTFKNEGLTVKKHGNAGKSPINTTPLEVTERAVKFIRNYAEQNAIFLPGRVSTVFNSNLKLLPSHESKSSIHRMYVAACKVDKSQAVKLKPFRKLWAQCCPYIYVQRPMSDLCKTCQSNYVSLSKLTLASEQQKLQQYSKSKAHLDKVLIEREYYKSTIQNSIEEAVGKTIATGRAEPCNYAGTCHYSFDMAQQVHIPHNPMQPGPIYFLTPFKLGLFGVMNDTLKKQCNFVIPESVVINKGANMIVSLLHYFFENFGIGEKIMHLHADNCVAQNKNNIVVSYLAWRVMMKLNTDITLSFLPVGHTKFAVDWAFGLLKKKFRVSEVNTIQEFCDVVADSTPSSKLNYAVAVGTEDGRVLVPMANWQEYFSDNQFKKLPQITSYSHFKFSNEMLGSVCVRHNIDEPWLLHVLTSSSEPPSGLPAQIIPEGMTDDRKDYLYKNIREYCSPEAKDILCPKPGAVADTPEQETFNEPDSPLPEVDPQHKQKKRQVSQKNRKEKITKKSRRCL